MDAGSGPRTCPFRRLAQAPDDGPSARLRYKQNSGLIEIRGGSFLCIAEFHHRDRFAGPSFVRECTPAPLLIPPRTKEPHAPRWEGFLPVISAAKR